MVSPLFIWYQGTDLDARCSENLPILFRVQGESREHYMLTQQIPLWSQTGIPDMVFNIFSCD